MKLKDIALGTLVNISRFAVAATFIFSGYVKAIDPQGTQYKIQDYLEALHITGYMPDYATLGTAVLLGSIEFCLGIFLLFAVHRHLVSRLILIFMGIMTPLTLWLAIDNPIKDCGCFGDALLLTNWQTFYKNIVLLAGAALLCKKPLLMHRFISKTNQWIVVIYTMLFILVSSTVSMYTLPQFDFRPYHIGVNIKDGMTIPKGAKEPKFETTFILEKNGTRKEFTLDNYPDSTWTFIDSKTVQTEEGYVPPIHDFSIQTIDTEEDITDSVISQKGYVFLFISPHLEVADDSNFGDIDRIYEYCQEKHYPFYALTASTEKGIQHWRDITGAEYNFYITDETTLKTIIRSNPGLLLLKDGTIIGKWGHNTLPDLTEESPALEKTPYGHITEKSITQKISEIILWYLLPLLIISLLDRIWHFSLWIRRNNILTRYINFLKQKRK